MVILIMVYSDSMSPTSLGMQEHFYESLSLRPCRRSQFTLTICLCLPGLSGRPPPNDSNSTPGGDQLTALPLSSPVAWYQLCATLCSNTVFVMDNRWLAQKSKNKTPFRFRSGRLFLPITPFQVTPSLPTWALFLRREMESPAGIPSRTPLRYSKKAG